MSTPYINTLYLQIIPLYIEKEITPSDDIAEIIIKTQKIHDGDIIVVAQKIISKQEGRLVDLSTVKPSLLAQGISSCPIQARSQNNRVDSL